MPAITVRSTKISKVGSNDVQTLRVSVDRSLASVGGPAAGIVASGAVVVSNADFTLPALVLYSTYNAADEITRGAQYRAELLDSLGNVVATLPGFEAFQIRNISAQTTWNEIREYNDFIAITQGLDNDNLGNSTAPTLLNSIIGILGATARAAQDTIAFYFGMGINPPGIRRNVATAQMEFSHDGLTWTAMGSGGGAGITGSGTVGYLPRWTAGTVLGDSDMFYDAGLLTTIVQNNFNANGNVAFGLDQFVLNSNPTRAINVPFLTLKNKAGQTGAVLRLDNSANGGGIQTLITPTGDIRPRGVTYNWPAANAAGQLTNDGAGNLTWTPGGGGAGSFTLAGDSGAPQTINSGDTATFVGGLGIATVAQATDQLVINVDVFPGGGLQASFGTNQLGILLDSASGGGNNVATLSASGLYVPPYSWSAAGDTGAASPIPTGSSVRFLGRSGLTSVLAQLSGTSFEVRLDVDLLSTGGLQTSGGADQLGIKLDTTTGGGNNVAQLSASGLYVPPGGGAGTFTLAGDSGTPQTINSGDTATFVGGLGIATVAQATDQLVINVDLLSTGGLQTSGGASQLGIKLDTTTGGGNNVAQLSASGLYVPPGGGAGTFTLAGDSGTPQTINSGDTATFVGGLGIATVAQATDQLVINVDLLSTGGLQTSGGASQLGIKLDTVAVGNAATLSANGLYVPTGAGGSFNYQGNTGGVGTLILNSVDILFISGGSGCNTVTTPGTDTITIDLDLAPAQSGRPNNASIILSQLYAEPREYKRTRAVSANTALIPATDNVILVNTGGGNITITLTTPAAGEYNNFTIKKTTTDANTITLSPASGQIDGAASEVFSGVVGSAGEAAQIVWDGTNWWIIGRS
ncbi:MAG TPA: hypothetical protein PKC13_03795 [Blastocatellia bacterium]|nr:hypothetical protein [Blastocatellia bacterium]